MEQLHKRPILLLITNSFAAINVIHSGLIKEMDRKFKIHIFSSMLGNAEVALINKHFEIETSLIDIPFPVERNLIALLRRIQKAIFFHYFNIETQRIKPLSGSGISHFLIYQTLWILGFLKLNGIILTLVRRLIINLTGHSRNLKKLYPYRFCGVLSSSPLSSCENRIVNFCSRNKIPSIGMIISWDNLTSKGIINANHNGILVWNQFMADEYRKFYSIFEQNRSEIYITGIPRFDIYFKKLPTDQKTDFKRKFNINPADKIILFATSSCKLFPHQMAIMQDLAAYLREHKHTTLIVRCHPADHFQLYEQFTNENHIRIWLPDKQTASAGLQSAEWMPGLDFLDSLNEMIQHCDVCVNVASTMRLDAAACNKHLISIAYDGDRNLPYSKSVRRLYDYSHQISLNKLNMDEVVFSKQELFSALNAVLTNFQACNNIGKVEPFIFHTSPEAVHTAMSAIEKCLN